MKVLDIALKDMLLSFRSTFALAMMFVMPLLITGLFYLALGNLTTDIKLPVTRIQVVNLDQALDQTQGFSAGQNLVTFLQNEKLAKIVQVTLAKDETSAKTAVDQQKADVAVIIPANFTAVIVTPKADASTSVTLYQDPTLKLRPSIVKGLVQQFMDTSSGSRIATNVTAQQALNWGITPDMTALQNIGKEYMAWAQTTGQGQVGSINLESPAKKEANQGSVIATVMIGMMIFFVFFTGASTAETIVKEDEEGTLSRLFTTPTPRPVILAGKFSAIFMTIIVQILILLAISALVFNIQWGDPWSIALITLGTVVVAAGFGILLMAFIKSTRQSGPIVGGVMAVTGMLGGLFTVGIPNLPTFLNILQLSVPQGWALRGWQQVLSGDPPGEVLLPTLVLVTMGGLCFTTGSVVIRKRFA